MCYYYCNLCLFVKVYVLFKLLLYLTISLFVFLNVYNAFIYIIYVIYKFYILYYF